MHSLKNFYTYKSLPKIWAWPREIWKPFWKLNCTYRSAVAFYSKRKEVIREEGKHNGKVTKFYVFTLYILLYKVGKIEALV